MEIRQAILFADEMKPNAFSEELKMQWINQVEGIIQTDVLLLDKSEFITYEFPTDANTKLLVDAPHDKLYPVYLAAMIDFTHGEYSKYQNTMEVFNAYLSEFSCWFADNYAPADGLAVSKGYYVSAYGIAVKNGFQGTEAEWLAGLKGEDGEDGEDGKSVELKYDEESRTLFWRQEGGEWQPLDGLSFELDGPTFTGVLPIEKGGTDATTPFMAARRLGRTFVNYNDSADVAEVKYVINGFSPTYGCLLGMRFKNGNTTAGLKMSIQRTTESTVYSSVVYDAHTGKPLTGKEIKEGQLCLFSWTEGTEGAGVTEHRWYLLNPSYVEHTHSLSGGDMTGALPVTKGGTGQTTAYAAMKALGQSVAFCGTAANVQTKVVDISGMAMIHGADITVRMGYGNTAANPKLQVGSDSAKPIYNGITGKIVETGDIAENHYCRFKHWADSSGSRWVLLNPAVVQGSETEKTARGLTLSASSVTMNMPALDEEKLITASYTGDKYITAVSSDESIATVRVSGKNIYINAHKKGSCRITVSLPETDTYQAAEVYCTVTVTLPDEVFANNTWAVIAQVVQKNRVPDSWKVGDSKEIEIEEGWSSVLADGESYTVDIIGRNHDAYADGSGLAPLTFQLHQCMHRSGEFSPTDGAEMYYGWEDSYMRNTHMEYILSLLPTVVQDAVREIKKITANGSERNISVTYDKLFLPSEMEIFGYEKYSLPGEGTQYEYYRAGNLASNVKQKWSETEGAWIDFYWWLRSSHKTADDRVCRGGHYSTGSGRSDFTLPDWNYAYNYNGVAFAFCF